MEKVKKVLAHTCTLRMSRKTVSVKETNFNVTLVNVLLYYIFLKGCEMLWQSVQYIHDIS
jgi:replication initiation and membrane attachment protein DnaB